MPSPCGRESHPACASQPDPGSVGLSDPQFIQLSVLHKGKGQSHSLLGQRTCAFPLHSPSGSANLDLDEKCLIWIRSLSSRFGSWFQSEGQVLKEASYINKSLSFLEQIVIALADPRRDHIPFRQSKLTHVLKDSLGKSCG